MQKIIDSHAHIGIYQDWNCDIKYLAKLKQKNKIERIIVGDISGNQCGAKSMKETLKMVRHYGEQFGVLLWINPSVKNDYETAEKMLELYSKEICGMKTHPGVSKARLDSEVYEPYMKLCEEYTIPFASHTEKDGYSDMAGLSKMAGKYPNVNFIAVHMELKSDHKEARDYIAKFKNLYGDTTFVSCEDTCAAIERCGAHKIIFGTDAPIKMEDSYVCLAELRNMILERFDENVLNSVFYENSAKLFVSASSNAYNSNCGILKKKW